MTFGVDKEFRPQGEGTESKHTHNKAACPNCIAHDPQFSHDPAVLERFRNCYAVLVRGKTVRRHLYLNLPGAIRAAERAQARGDRADLVLLKMVPDQTQRLQRDGGEGE